MSTDYLIHTYSEVCMCVTSDFILCYLLRFLWERNLYDSSTQTGVGPVRGVRADAGRPAPAAALPAWALLAPLPPLVPTVLFGQLEDAALAGELAPPCLLSWLFLLMAGALRDSHWLEVGSGTLFCITEQPEESHWVGVDPKGVGRFIQSLLVVFWLKS